MTFWYHNLDILISRNKVDFFIPVSKNKKFLISQNHFLHQKIEFFILLENHFLNSKNRLYFLISEIFFFDVRIVFPLFLVSWKMTKKSLPYLWAEENTEFKHQYDVVIKVKSSLKRKCQWEFSKSSSNQH